MSKIYIASKVKHAKKWVDFRDDRIISTWIYEAGEGESASYAALARRCLDEIRRCDWFVLYCEPSEILKGALIEVGAALALGKQVRVVGKCDNLSRVFNEHPLFETGHNLTSAFSEETILKVS